MGLTAVERCAGLWFRKLAEQDLRQDMLDFPDSVPCSALVSFYRHECPEQKGRTRSVALGCRTLVSPEIWVTWVNQDPVIPGTPSGRLTVISREDAEARVMSGMPVEVEQVLAGKFTFTWKKGHCPKCRLAVISRNGVFLDARPVKEDQQGDLASFVQRGFRTAREAVARECE